MVFNVAGCHALCIHGQDLFFDILTDAGLVLLQKLWFIFPFAISRYGNLHITEAGPQCLAAVPIPAVVSVLVLVIVLAVTEFVIQFYITWDCPFLNGDKPLF